MKPRGKLMLAGVIGLAIAFIGSFSFLHEESAADPQADPNAVFLPTELLNIKTSDGIHTFTVEIADEGSERQRGLMFREYMLPTHGMLFEFDNRQIIYMWMENTLLPLDMIFIRSDGSIAQIKENTVPFSREIIASNEAVSYVLELNAGMARKINLKPNDEVLHRFFNNAD